MPPFIPFLALLTLQSPAAPAPALADWTMMLYGAIDNSAEESFLPDLARLSRSLGRAPGLSLVVLCDRSPEFTDTKEGLGEDFADTRLYAFEGQEPVRQDGSPEFPEIEKDGAYEADTGDAHTLAKLIGWTKAHRPARHYALVFYTHGDGWRWSPDQTDGGDFLYPAELTDVLGAELSVDLLVFDVCLMGELENAYQWRPGNGGFSADVMVATPNAGFPFPWGRIFDRLRPGTAPEGEPGWLDPAASSALDFGRLIVDVTREHRLEARAEGPRVAEMVADEAMGCYDLARSASALEAVNALAAAIARAGSPAREELEALRGTEYGCPTMNYMPPEDAQAWMTPYFDVYDLCRLLRDDDALGDEVRACSETALAAVDALVVDSFGMQRYAGFEEGRHGCSLVFPDAGARDGAHAWQRFAWYTPGAVRKGTSGYGHYAACRAGAVEGDGIVQNWFELLDSWYDAVDGTGGVNGYRW